MKVDRTGSKIRLWRIFELAAVRKTGIHIPPKVYFCPDMQNESGLIIRDLLSNLIPIS